MPSASIGTMATASQGAGDGARLGKSTRTIPAVS